jgi:hypothetical protein
MKDSPHVDRFATTYRGSTCELRAEAATLRDAVMARNRFFHYLLLYWNHKWVQDQQIQTSITSVFIEIFRSHFSGACTWTVSNVLQNYNSLGSWVGGKMGVRKKKFSQKFFFPVTFLPLSQQSIVDTCSLKRTPKHGGPVSYRFRVMGGRKFSPK